MLVHLFICNILKDLGYSLSLLLQKVLSYITHRNTTNNNNTWNSNSLYYYYELLWKSSVHYQVAKMNMTLIRFRYWYIINMFSIRSCNHIYILFSLVPDILIYIVHIIFHIDLYAFFVCIWATHFCPHPNWLLHACK